MAWIIVCALLLIAVVAAGVFFWARIRMLDACEQAADQTVDADRYRPMLRLLSVDDAELTADPVLRRKLRTQRSDLFREYLRSLTADYGKLLASVRLIMIQSGCDRPDLAKALVKNRVLFAVALCRIDFRLLLYGLGIGKAEALRVDVLHLVDAVNILRNQFGFLAESAVWGT